MMVILMGKGCLCVQLFYSGTMAIIHVGVPGQNAAVLPKFDFGTHANAGTDWALV